MKIGKTTNGQDIIALKVTLGAPLLKDGAKPSTLYMSAQHAREWITPEMNRRLMHYFVDGYLRNRQVTNLINTTELWFVPVSNPDGYDFTFTPGQRLWRKNLRDNNGDGEITNGDGVDPNRNYAYKWGYDNEGSSRRSRLRDLPRPRPELRARVQGDGQPVQARRRLHRVHQLPLGGRADPLRRRLAGQHAHAGRPARHRDVRRRRQPGRPGL